MFKAIFRVNCKVCSSKREGSFSFTIIRISFLLSRVSSDCQLIISHVLNEHGTGYEHIFSLVQTFNID